MAEDSDQEGRVMAKHSDQESPCPGCEERMAQGLSVLNGEGRHAHWTGVKMNYTKKIHIHVNGLVESLEAAQDVVVEWAKVKGWEPDPGRSFGDECALLHSEVSEALEAFRDYGFKDVTKIIHAPLGTAAPIAKPEGVASEFADIFIRLIHYCHSHNINLGAEFERKMAYNWTRAYRHGGRSL